MNKYLKIILFSIILTTLFFLNGVLIDRIYKYTQDNVKGIHIAVLNKDNLIFDNSVLKYYYEPKSDHIENDNPQWLGHQVRYLINSDSLNERFDYALPKPKDTFRIVSLGASVTFGRYVDTNDNYTEVLENDLNTTMKCPKFNKFEVINLGVGAYDIEYEINRFVKRGIKYDPDLVIWMLDIPSILRINEELIPIKYKFASEGIPVIKVGINNLLSVIRSRDEYRAKFSEENILRYQKNILSQFINKYDRYNFLIISASLPLKYEDLINSLISGSKYNYYDRITDIKSETNLHFPTDNHPNIEGHKRIADDIYNYLLKNNLIDCKV